MTLLHEIAATVSADIELRARLEALTSAEADRERDRELLRSVLECMEDSVVVAGPGGKVLMTNHAARCARPAESLETVQSLAAYGLFFEDGTTPLTTSAAPATRALHGEQVRDFVLVRRQAGLPKQTLSVNASPIRDSAGKIVAAVSVARDITRSNAASEALAKNEAIFRTVLQNLPKGAVLLFDRDLRYMMAEGKQLLVSMGFTTGDVLGKTPFDVVADGRAEALAQRYRSSLAGFTEEFELTRDERTFACTIVPVRDALGLVIAGMALVYDVTAHKQVEEALRMQTLVFQSTLEHMREGVVMVSPNGEFVVFNHAAKAFFGVQPLAEDIPALLSKLSFFHEDGQTPMKECEQPLARALYGEATFPTDVVVRAGADGPATHLHVTVDPILDDRNTLLGSVAVLHNVTAQRAAERSAREEAALSDLLQGIAVAANSAHDVHDAFQVCLDRVCTFMRWPIGQVYLKQATLLKSAGWWYDADPERFARFREVGSTLNFAPGTGMIGKVLASGEPTWIADLKSDEGYVRPETAAEAGLVSAFAFPVLIEDEVVAALEFYSERKEDADSRLLSLMANIGTQLGRVIERERARKAIEEQSERVRSLSIRDELTELHNRRGFLELAIQQLRLAERMKRPALLFFFDLNGMKPINDELGHEEGDRALCEMADVLRVAFRGSDIIARLGGDEFVALLPDAERSLIALFVSRIEHEIAKRNAQPGRKYELSASIGGCAFDPCNAESIDELIVRADALMYEQKRLHGKTRDSAGPAGGGRVNVS